MKSEQLFRWLCAAIFLAAFSISAYFRRRARGSGDVVRRVREGRLILWLRLVLAALLYVSMLAYVVNPEWMAWSSMPVPTWLRWAAATVAIGMVSTLFWVFRTLGSNVTETFLTKEHHALVTHGPYRWVRHPLYAVATIAFVSLGIVAANWFITGMAAIAITGVVLFVIPREETHLVQKFGAEYQEYAERTGRLIPRLRLFD